MYACGVFNDIRQIETNMTEKKIPTITQMKEYRQMRKTMSSQADYDKVLAFEQEYDVFTKVYSENGKLGVKDAIGKVLVPAFFDEIGYTYSDSCRGFAVPVIKDGKMALVSPDGKGTMLTEAIYDQIRFSDCSFILYKDGKQGLATGSGLVVVPAEMDEVFLPMNALVIFTKDGKNGFAMSGTGLITEPEYDDFEIVEHEYLKVYKNGEEGYIDEDGHFTTDEDMRFFHADVD